MSFCLKYLRNFFNLLCHNTKSQKLILIFRDSKLIIDGYLECLSSSDPEIVMSAAKVLSEISILAAG